MSAPHDELLDHDYDGIREYDNPLPRWWLVTFYGTIAFAAVYVPYFHFGPGQLPHEEYAAEMAAAKTAAPPSLTSAQLATAVADPAGATRGKATYDKLCMPCHRADGGGLVGPNLTDDHWIHGGSPADQVKIVTDGVPAKGMISWKAQLSQGQIVDVVAYIRTLRGTRPADGKAPEGRPYGGD